MEMVNRRLVQDIATVSALDTTISLYIILLYTSHSSGLEHKDVMSHSERVLSASCSISFRGRNHS